MNRVVQLRFKNANAFLGLYLAQIRRGGTLLVDAPALTLPGDVVDIQVLIDGHDPLLLFGQVERTWGHEVEVRFVAGRTTDRAVYPMLSRALSRRQANRLLEMIG